MSELKGELDKAWKRLAAAQRTLERCQEQFDSAAMSVRRAQKLAEGKSPENDNE